MIIRAPARCQLIITGGRKSRKRPDGRAIVIPPTSSPENRAGCAPAPLVICTGKPKSSRADRPELDATHSRRPRARGRVNMSTKPFEPKFMKVGVLTAALQELTPREVRDPDPDRAVEDWVAFAGEIGVG